MNRCCFCSSKSVSLPRKSSFDMTPVLKSLNRLAVNYQQYFCGTVFCFYWRAVLQGVRYFFNPRTYKGVEWSGVMSNFDNFFFTLKNTGLSSWRPLGSRIRKEEVLHYLWEGIQGKMLQMDNCLLSRIFRDRKLIAIEMKNIYDVRDKSL